MIESSHTSPDSRSGLTLIELLLAITIFVLVVGTIFISLRAATTALAVGKESMEMYQTTRAGLNRMILDLRRALGPASFPFNEREEEDPLAEEDYYLDDGGPQMQVTFKGDTSSVQFVVRQEMETDNGPTMDIREVRYKVSEDGKLVKEIYRSLLEARMAEIQARRMEQRQPMGGDTLGRNRQRYEPPPNAGFFEKPIVQALCDKVEEVKFAYFDGKEWRDNWDSEEIIINEFSREFSEEDLTEEDEERLGLPRLVRVDVKVTEDVRLSTSTAIPSADLNIVSARASESDFGSAYRSSMERLDRLRTGDRSLISSPRIGERGRRDRRRR